MFNQMLNYQSNKIIKHATCTYTTLLQGKMKACSLFIYINLCCIYRYTTIEIKPKERKHILNFGYSINYKYEKILTHSFDRFYIVTKFILLTVKDLKFSTLKFDDECEYLQEYMGQYSVERQYILDLKVYCTKIQSYVHFYKQQIVYLNQTAHHILKNKRDLILPQFPTNRIEMRGVMFYNAVSV